MINEQISSKNPGSILLFCGDKLILMFTFSHVLILFSTKSQKHRMRIGLGVGFEFLDIDLQHIYYERLSLISRSHCWLNGLYTIIQDRITRASKSVMTDQNYQKPLTGVSKSHSFSDDVIFTGYLFLVINRKLIQALRPKNPRNPTLPLCWKWEKNQNNYFNLLDDILPPVEKRANYTFTLLEREAIIHYISFRISRRLDILLI